MNWKPTWIAAIACGALWLLSLPGCSSDDDGCTDSCALDGDTRCSGDEKGIETCSPDADACLKWSYVACDSQQACSLVDESPTCKIQCQDECVADDYPLCSGESAVQTCVEMEDGCTDLISTNCYQGQTCDPNNAGCAGCTDETDECTVSGVVERTVAINTTNNGDGIGTLCLAIADYCPGPPPNDEPTSFVALEIQDVDLSQDGTQIPFSFDVTDLINGSYVVMGLFQEAGGACVEAPSPPDLASAKFMTLDGCPVFSYQGESTSDLVLRLNFQMM